MRIGRMMLAVGLAVVVVIASGQPATRMENSFVGGPPPDIAVTIRAFSLAFEGGEMTLQPLYQAHRGENGPIGIPIGTRVILEDETMIDGDTDSVSGEQIPSPPCGVDCDEIDGLFECFEKESGCPPLEVFADRFRETDFMREFEGVCAVTEDEPDEHGRATFGSCKCVYWVGGPPVRIMGVSPGARVTVQLIANFGEGILDSKEAIIPQPPSNGGKTLRMRVTALQDEGGKTTRRPDEVHSRL